MTEPRKTTEPTETAALTEPDGRPAPPDQPAPPAPDLLSVVTSVPGVRAIEPGLGTSLRTLDARLRRSPDRTAHFGLHIDTAEGTAVVEVALDRSRPVRDTVRDIQFALHRALVQKTHQAGDSTTADAPVAAPAGAFPAGPPTSPEVTVRVQSLHR